MSSSVSNTTPTPSTYFDLHSRKLNKIDDVPDQFVSTWNSSTTLDPITKQRDAIDLPSSKKQSSTQSSESNNISTRSNNDPQHPNVARHGRKVRPRERFLQEMQ